MCHHFKQILLIFESSKNARMFHMCLSSNVSVMIATHVPQTIKTFLEILTSDDRSRIFKNDGETKRINGFDTPLCFQKCSHLIVHVIGAALEPNRILWSHPHFEENVTYVISHHRLSLTSDFENLKEYKIIL